MDAAYDALDAAASSYTKSRDGDDDGRSHRSHRDREYDRDRDRDRHRDGERRHRDRDERDDRYRERERDGRDNRDARDGRDSHRDRERDRVDRVDRGDRSGGREYRDNRGGGYERERDYDDRGPRRRRREDEDFGRAEPMGPGGGGPPGDRHRDRRPRYDEEPFAAPMRGYDAPAPPRHEGGGYGGGGGGGYGGGGGRDGGFRGRGGGDDWRGGGRGGGPRGGDRGGGRRNSPPRSPTPPGTRPLEERHLETSLWDIRPKEFQGIGAMEAKMTGMFTYGPGRVPPPAHLGIPQSLIAGSFPPGDSVNPMRQSKRLYVGGVNETMNETEIKNRMDAKLREIPPFNTTIEEPIQLCQMNLEKGYAFIEFKTADEANTAIDFLDNFVWDDKTTLRVKRPKDYIGIDPSLGMLGEGGDVVAESPNKLFIGGLPTYLNDDQVLELLKSFGEVKSFNLVKDGTESKGFAFAEYNDTETTDMAIAGLHNFNLGDRTLVVQRAAMGKNTGVPGTYSGGYYAASVLANANSTDKPSSRVILLLNMVTADDLYDDDDYNDILEDVNEECGKFGEVEGVRVPRPLPKNTKWEIHDSDYQRLEKSRREDERNGVGRVYVMYYKMESAADAIKALAGRQFAGRTILVANVPEAEFLGPAPPPPPAAIEAAPEGWREEEDGGATASAAAPVPVPIAVKPKPPPKNIDDAAADALADILG